MPMTRPCLWFDSEGEEAANHYVSIFPSSRVVRVTRYGSAGPRAEGTVMTVDFELDGQPYMALNGGPDFRFNEAISLEVTCADQAEVDHYWERLGAGGEHGPCGWLKDRFGVSWQVVPAVMDELIADPDPERGQRAMAAMLQMGKLDIDALQRAADGG